jgi:Predicted nucleoside-diphosphate sugar epimerases
LICEDNSKNLRILLLSDVMMVLLAFIGALFITNDFIIPIFLFSKEIFQVLGVFVVVKLSCYYFFGLYLGMWRYTSLFDMANIVKANMLGTLSIIAIVGYLARI